MVIGIIVFFTLTPLCSPSSRTKAKEARIINEMSAIRALLESSLDQYGYYRYDLVASSIDNAKSEIEKLGGSNFVTSVTSSAFAIKVQLPSGNYYCVDSQGNSIITTTKILFNQENPKCQY